MNRNELLKELMTRYSFEIAHSLIQFARQDREYENKDVHIVAIRTVEDYIYSCKWKN